MHRMLHFAVGLGVAVLLACPGRAAVLDSSATGFTVKETFQTTAPPAKVYAELIQPSHWWSAEHSYSHNAANFTLDARAGGCWCETLPDGGSVQHMTVVLIMPGKMLRLRGALGPLQGLGVDGALTVVLTPAPDGGTMLTATYALVGYTKDGLAQFAAAVDAVVGEGFQRLKSDIETGSPEAKH